MIKKIYFFSILWSFYWFAQISGFNKNEKEIKEIREKNIQKLISLTDIKENNIAAATERFKKNNCSSFLLSKYKKRMLLFSALPFLPLFKKQQRLRIALKVSIPLCIFGFYLHQVNQINTVFKEIIINNEIKRKNSTAVLKEEVEEKKETFQTKEKTASKEFQAEEVHTLSSGEEEYLMKIHAVTKQILPWSKINEKKYQNLLSIEEIRKKYIQNPHSREEKRIIEDFYDTYLLSEKELAYIGFEFGEAFFRKNLLIKDSSIELQDEQLKDFYIEDAESYTATLKEKKELFSKKRDKLKEKNNPWLKEYYPNARCFVNDYTTVAKFLLGEKNVTYQSFFETIFYKNIQEILTVNKTGTPFTVHQEEIEEKKETFFSHAEMIEKRIKNIKYQQKIYKDRILQEYYNKFAFIPIPVAFSFYGFEVDEKLKETAVNTILKEIKENAWKKYLNTKEELTEEELTEADYLTILPLQKEKYIFITKHQKEILDKEVLFFDSHIPFHELLDAIKEIAKDKDKYDAFKNLIKSFSYITVKSKYHYYWLSIMLETTWQDFHKKEDKENIMLCAAFELAFNFYPDTCLEFKKLAHPYQDRYETKKSENYYSNSPYTTDGRILTFLEHIVFFGLSWNQCSFYEKAFTEICSDQSIRYEDSKGERQFNCSNELCNKIHKKDAIEISTLFKFLKKIKIFSTRDFHDEEKIDENSKYNENHFKLSHGSPRPRYIKIEEIQN